MELPPRDRPQYYTDLCRIGRRLDSCRPDQSNVEIVVTPEEMKVTIVGLRSGEYKQVRGWIGDYYHNQLCCIGVAAKVNGARGFTDTGAACDFLLMTRDQKTVMVDWNDTMMLSFPEIADRMETHPLFLGGV